MANYRECVLTNQGLDFARKADNGLIQFSFTKGVLSAEEHNTDSSQALQNITSLNAFVTSDPVSYKQVVDVSNVIVPLRFTNANQTDNNYVNTVGIYASDGINEVLYSIIINDDPDLFPAYNGKTPQYIKINAKNEVGRASQVTTTVSPFGMVTEEEFSAATKNWELSASHSSDVSSLSAEIGSVSSAIDNNSGIASEFSSVSSGVATNSSAITLLQSSVSTNSNDIGSLQTSVNSNSSNISTLQTSVSNNANSIATNSNSMNNLANSISAVSSAASSSANSNALRAFEDEQSISANINSISNLNNATLQYRGVLNGSLLNVDPLLDGYYHLIGNGTDGPSDFSGYGLYLKTSVGADHYVTLIQSNNTMWKSHEYNGNWDLWQRFASNTDVVNLQNQVNGVLARQSNLIQTLLNNSIYRLSQYVPLSYNMSNNIITFGNYTLNGNYVDVGTLFSYCKALGYNNVSFSLINGSSYGITSLDTSELNDEQLLFNFTGSAFQQTNVPINGLQMQVTYS